MQEKLGLNNNTKCLKMSSIISNAGQFSGGYFILNNAAKDMSFVEGNAFVVTCKNNKGLLSSILKLISASQSYIKICSFIIDNKNVFDSLKMKLKDGKVSIFILTAVDDKNIRSDMLDEDESSEFSKSRHFEFIDELVKNGAHVRASSNAHAKFIIKDGNEALLTSANLTEPSLNNNEKGKEPNYESGILLTDTDEVAILERIFDSVFLYGTEFRKFINLKDKTQLISKNDNEILSSDFPDANTNVIWSYEGFHNIIYDKIIELINSGCNSIKLSTYSIVALNNLPEFVAGIRNFLSKDKATIHVFCRAMNHRTDHLEACKLLAELGVQIFGDIFNHSKGVSVDNNEGIIFTANIDGKHGLKSGFEVGYVINSTNNSFGSFNLFLDYQIATAPFVFSLNPNKMDLFKFYHFWYQDKGIKAANFLPENIEIKYRSNSNYAKEFENDILRYPIYYTVVNKQDKPEIQFEINGKAYLLDCLNESTLAVKKQLHWKEIVNAEKHMFFYNKINLTNYEA
jgi:phosphatidylserine/phosphatidylglycerophosphate/cardiolipin synthase-like enzyme